MDGVPDQEGGRARVVATQLGFAAAYAAAAWLGRATVLPGERVSLVWPAAGVAVLWLLWSSKPAVVLVVLAAELAGVLLATGASSSLTLVGVMSSVLQGWVILTLIRRWAPQALGAGGAASIHSLTTLVRGTAAVVLGCACGAVVGVLGLRIDGGPASWEDAALWFGRQTAGVMIVGSVGHLTWERLVVPGVRRMSGAMRTELVLVWTVSAALYAAVFLNDLPLAYLVLPTSVWCAVRFSTYAAAIHASVFGTVAIGATLAGLGPFAQIADAAEASLATQGFVIVALVTSLVLGSVRDQREEVVGRLAVAESTAAARARMLAAMTEAMTEGMVLVDESGQVVQTNAAARALLTRTASRGSTVAVSYELLRPDGSAVPAHDYPYRRALDEGHVASHDVLIPLDDGARRTLSVRATRLDDGADAVVGPAALVVYRDVTSERAESLRLAQFAEVTAHDLRSPLTTVRGWLSMAMDELTEQPLSVEELRRLMTKALGGAVRLGELIDDMLDHALAEGAELHLEALDLGGPDGLAADIGEMLGIQSLTLASPPGPLVHADHQAVRQLMSNLLGNAVKYADPSRPLAVEIQLSRRGSRVDVGVSDNGRGIPAHQQETVFDRFARADSAGAVAGSGLGLSLCKLVVERHGGTIACSEGPGGLGTTFTFDLPAYD